MRLLVMARGAGRRFALVRGADLIEYHVDEPGRASRIGEVHLGRVLRVETAIDAAFVEIGSDRPALLPLGDHDGGVREGDAVVVQLVRDARDGKGARVTGRPVLPGLYVVLDPARPGIGLSSRIADRAAGDRLKETLAPLCDTGQGFVLRRAAIDAAPEAIVAEAARLQELWRGIVARRSGLRAPALLHRDADPMLALLRDVGAGIEEIVVDGRGPAEQLRQRLNAVLPGLASRVTFRPARDWSPPMEEIEEQLDAALDPELKLPGGGSLLFEPGRTLTAIDVNSGAAASGAGRKPAERRFLEANLEAVAEIARQLRLRNLGGIIVIDFIDLKAPASRARVVEALRDALAADPAPTQIGPMSRFGLVEMTRRRRGASLAELLTGACPTCDGLGRVRFGGTPERGGEG